MEARGQGAPGWHGESVGSWGTGECLLLPLSIHISQLASCGLAVVVAEETRWHRGLSRGGPRVEPQPWGAVGFRGVGAVCWPFPGTASQPLARRHTGGFSLVLALSAIIPRCCSRGCSFLVFSLPPSRSHRPRGVTAPAPPAPAPCPASGEEKGPCSRYANGKRQLGGSCALPSLGKCLRAEESGKSPCAGGSGLGWPRGAPRSQTTRCQQGHSLSCH